MGMHATLVRARGLIQALLFQTARPRGEKKKRLAGFESKLTADAPKVAHLVKPELTLTVLFEVTAVYPVSGTFPHSGYRLESSVTSHCQSGLRGRLVFLP
jgi:hypothetical protein